MGPLTEKFLQRNACQAATFDTQTKNKKIQLPMAYNARTTENYKP